MGLIQMPFTNMFQRPLELGVKVCTARPTPLAKHGDVFRAFGELFRVEEVSQVWLWEVADLWREEGCYSPEHFIEVWNTLHPPRSYKPFDMVYLHRFKKIF